MARHEVRQRTTPACPLLSPLHVLLRTATQMVQPVWPRSGEMRRPAFGHAQLLPSPRKRGGDIALVKQVSDVIGWRVGRCSSVPSFHPSSVSSGKIARRATGSSALCSGRLTCVHHHLLSAHNIIVHFTSGKFAFSFVFNVHRLTFSVWRRSYAKNRPTGKPRQGKPPHSWTVSSKIARIFSVD